MKSVPGLGGRLRLLWRYTKRRWSPPAVTADTDPVLSMGGIEEGGIEEGGIEEGGIEEEGRGEGLI